MLKNLKGIYKIYFHKILQYGDESHLIGRIMFENGQCHILEDHNGLLSEHLSDGPISEDHLKFMDKLMHSAYYKVVSEADINSGRHADLLPELDLGPVDADHEYLLVTQTGEKPERVEIFGSNWVVDGKNLSSEEKQQLFQVIRAGQAKLYPL